MCPEHEMEKVNMYCEVCRRPVCHLCKLGGSHANHKVTSMSNAYKILKVRRSDAAALRLHWNVFCYLWCRIGCPSFWNRLKAWILLMFLLNGEGNCWFQVAKLTSLCPRKAYRFSEVQPSVIRSTELHFTEGGKTLISWCQVAAHLKCCHVNAWPEPVLLCTRPEPSVAFL